MNRVPEYLGTNNKLMAELQRLATADTAQYFYNQTPQPEFIPNRAAHHPFGPETITRFADLDKAKEELRVLAAD